MRRLASIVASLLVAAACGGSAGDDPVVASVNGTDIHSSDVIALRTTPADEVVLDSEEFRGELMYLVAQRTVESALEADFGVVVTPGDVTAALDEQLAAGGVTLDEAIAALADPAATEARLRAVIRSQLLRNAALDELGTQTEFLDDIFANNLDVITDVCVRHVLVEDDALAAATLARLRGGADFASVAGEVSIDGSTPDGNLGCASPARYVDEFAAATLEAPVGEVFGPVETQFGFHVILVDDRFTPTRAEIEADPSTYLPAELMSTEFTVWFNDRLKSADITVLPEVGVWAPVGPGIAPPE